MIKKRLIGLFPGSKKYIALQVLWQWLSLLCRVIFFMDIALLLGGMMSLDYGIKLNGDGIRLLYLIPIPVSILLRFLLDQMANDASFKASRDVKMILREEIYEKLLRLGPAYKESVNTAEVTTLVTEGVEQTESYFSQYLPQLFYAAVSEITLFIVLLFVNVKAAVIILIFIPLIPLSIVAVQKIAKRMLSGYFSEYLNLSDSFLESLNILTTLKIFGSDPHRSAALSEESENFRKTTMKVLLMQLNSTSIMDILAYGGAAAGMITGVYSYFNGDVAFTGALLIILLAVEFFLPMRRLGSFFHVAMNGMASSDRIFELLDIPEESSGEDIFPHGPAKIRVTDLKYIYSDEREKSTELHGRGAIRGMSLVINPGEVTAIVGKSGCGKSTFAKVLSGSLKGYEGSIKINGIEINTIDDHDRMLRIAYIDSDPYIFRGSVRENLQMARHETTDDDMVKVLRRVSLWEDLIDQNGLDTYLTEEGKNISAGQRQRLAMARVLLSHAKVFIFDEATSATDHETEEILLDLIYELAKEGKTVILISHRLSNVEKADVIYYMDEGQITESGAHDRLVFDDGAYSALYEIQSELEKYGRTNHADGSFDSATEDSKDTDSAITRTAPAVAVSQEPSPQETDAPRRNPVAVMLSLVMLVKPLVPIMVIAIILGTIGAFAAAFVTIQGGRLLVSGSFDKTGAIILVAAAVLRGILHYGEQYANHDIAFKLLSTIRGRVFGKLRTLAPAKLLRKDKGDMLSLLTGDIELLEVFYAHTISPVLIAVLMTIIMTVYMAFLNIGAAIIALFAYIVIGALLPIRISKTNNESGYRYRKEFTELNSFMVMTLRGLPEILRFGEGKNRGLMIEEKGEDLSDLKQDLSYSRGIQSGVTNLLIGLFSLIMLAYCIVMNSQGWLSAEKVVLVMITLMSSFGPVVALSDLSSTLNQTLAAGERVLLLLKEKPVVRDIRKGKNVEFEGAELRDVDFFYPGQNQNLILSKFNLKIEKGELIGICGDSGSGKSTVFRLLMRFYDPVKGYAILSGNNIRGVNTASLRKNVILITQETELFNATIAENIAVAKPSASLSEIKTAARKARISDFIEALPSGYNTNLGELGQSLSAGERQRIAIARAFLSDAPLILLDEPTSNLDALNEGMILKSLKEEAEHRTIVLSSHRETSLGICDRIVRVW